MRAKGISLLVAAGILGYGAAGLANPYLPAYGEVRSWGGDLELTIDGEGCFLLSDGGRDMLTREGRFHPGDGDYLYDIDYGPRMLLQRVGTTGEAGGYQTPGVGAIRIPYDLALAPQATTSISFAGNLSTGDNNPTRQMLSTGTVFEVGGSRADAGTLLAQLDQARGLEAGDEIRIAGTSRGGQPVSAVLPIDPARTTLGDLAGAIADALPAVTAQIVWGRLRVSDNEPGYSRTDLTLTYAGGGSLDLNGYFQMLSAGGEAARETVVEVMDHRGVSRALSGAFVRTDQAGVWDFVVTTASGALTLEDRRVEGIRFNADGSYAGPTGPAAAVEMTFPGGGPAMQLMMDFGTPGHFNGLSGFGGWSTAAAVGQDGIAAGWLTRLLVQPDGTITGQFTNGRQGDFARLAVVVPAPSEHPHPVPGRVVTRGDRLDLAIEGDGHFVVAGEGVTGQLREAAFVVDHAYRIADPTTGLRLQRTGMAGEELGFQTPGDLSIRIPYDRPIPARATTTISYRGNLSADPGSGGCAMLGMGSSFTVDGFACDGSALLAEVDQAAGVGDGDRIVISGTNRRGEPVRAELTIQAGATTLGDLASAVSTAFEGSTASIHSGELRLRDDEMGYSLTDVTLAYEGAGSLPLPSYFRIYNVGAEATRDTNVDIYDAAGEAHVLSGTFARSREGEWDFVLTNVTGEVDGISRRRVRGIDFDYHGVFEGPDPTEAQFRLTFAGQGAESVLWLDFGAAGALDALVNFGGPSTAAPDDQDGWTEGGLSSLDVTLDGTLWGRFTNGRTVEIARIDVAVPEPATAAMLAAGTLVLPWMPAVRRRRRRCRRRTL